MWLLTCLTAFKQSVRVAAAAPSSSVELLCFQQRGLVQFLDQVIDVPVVVLVRFGRNCGGLQLQFFSCGSYCSCCSSKSGHYFWSPLLTVLSQCFASVSEAFWRGASASVHRRVVVTSVETVAQTGDSMVQFRMVVDMHVAVQMTGY